MLSDTTSSSSEHEIYNFHFERNTMSIFEASKSLHNLSTKAFLKCYFLTQDPKNFQTYENISLSSKDKDKEFWVFCSQISVEGLVNGLKEEIRKKTDEDSLKLTYYDNSLKDEALNHFVVFESIRKLTKTRLTRLIEKYSKIQEFRSSHPSLSINQISIIVLCAKLKLSMETEDSIEKISRVQTDSNIPCTILGHIHMKVELPIADELEKFSSSLKALLQEKKRLFAGPWDRELAAYRKPRERIASGE